LIGHGCEVSSQRRKKQSGSQDNSKLAGPPQFSALRPDANADIDSVIKGCNVNDVAASTAAQWREPCFVGEKMNLKSLVIGAAFAATVASAPAGASGLLYYGGDLDQNGANGLANENDAPIPGSPYGAATYDNFVVTGPTWHVTGLFTNNLSQLNPETAYYEIRTGVSEGNGGTLVYSGTVNVTQTATGRSAFGITEYQDLVNVDFTLSDGTYWMSVVPLDPASGGRSYNSRTVGLNGVGTHIANLDYFNSGFLVGHVPWILGRRLRDGRRPRAVDLGPDGSRLRRPRFRGFPRAPPGSRRRVSVVHQANGKAALRSGLFRSRVSGQFRL
jgi:hypothetical protein